MHSMKKPQSAKYKETIQLPHTTFSMRANLPANEPNFLKYWEEIELYETLLKQNEEAPLFIFHDGPPYASGPIHYGHVFNKLLKDFILRFRSMRGERCEFTPGWDCHGLPIELQVEQNLVKEKQEVTPLELRQHCREYAQESVDLQSQELQRLGLLGHWDRPYKTMDAAYEADVTRGIAELIRQKALVRRNKPVYWCPSCSTALAEFELEQLEKESPSLFVGFPLITDPLNIDVSLRNRFVEVVVWTTMPWSLPANKAIAVHPEATYVALRHGKKIYILAENQVNYLVKVCRWKRNHYEIVVKFKGEVLKGMVCRHPFIHAQSPILLSHHVTLEIGTGCVHTAPGHGFEDYKLALKAGIEVESIIDAKGRYTSKAGQFAGQDVFEAEPKIIRKLERLGALLNPKETTFHHSYPHCWRCHHPVIFRATPQWFIPIQDQKLLDDALEATDKIEWIPASGKERMTSMLRNRPDWCLSRQRVWGVPLPIFYCTRCQHPLLSAENTERLADLYEQTGEGSDLWFKESVEKLLPQGESSLSCQQCGHTEFSKEQDIVDVWFESGLSHLAVTRRLYGDEANADLYLESTTQHRGWFQSSLLTSLQIKNRPPVKTIFTHGYVIESFDLLLESSEEKETVLQDPRLSEQNVILTPQEVISLYGAEFLRLWTASKDARSDVVFSKSDLPALISLYRKIRNTARFLLSNLFDFDPQKDLLPYEALEERERYALQLHRKFVQRTLRAYEDYKFHKVLHSINNYCIVDLSGFLFELSKDHLYHSSADAPERRSTQTAFFFILRDLARIMAPLFAFTSEEIWQHIPAFAGKKKSVHLAQFPEVDDYPEEKELLQRWQLYRKMRKDIYKLIESQRGAHHFKQLSTMMLKLFAKDPQWHDLLVKIPQATLTNLLLVAKVEFLSTLTEMAPDAIRLQNAQWTVDITIIQGDFCARCRRSIPHAEQNEDNLCLRCREIIQ